MPWFAVKLSADIIKTLIILLLKCFIHVFDQEFHGIQRNLFCGAFLPDELYAKLSYSFHDDNFILKNSKYFWYSYCHLHSFPLFSLLVGGNFKTKSRCHTVDIVKFSSNCHFT